MPNPQRQGGPLQAAGTTFRTIYLDAEGLEQHAVYRTSAIPDLTDPAKAHLYRQAIETYYRTIGCELLSAQVMIEQATYVEDTRPAMMACGRRDRGFLRLAASHGKRIYSEDVWTLARSIGKTPDQVFGSKS